MILIDIKQKSDLIKLKKTLIKNAKEEKLENIIHDVNLEKAYKPIIEPLKKIAEEAKQTKESIEGIKTRQAILPPEKAPILAIEDKNPHLMKFGPIASKYISQIANKEFDSTYGLKFDADTKTFQLGNQEVEIQDNKIIIGDYEYELNDNAWKLLTMKDVGKLSDYHKDDQHVYADIIMSTKAFLKEDGRYLIAPRMKKYNQVIKPIINQYQSVLARRATENIQKTQERQRSLSESGPSGQGIIILPSDINEIVKRHQLLLSSYEAGNTGVYNEIQAINNKLLSEGILNEGDLINFSKIFVL